MSFDYLRQALEDRDGWIMALDTRGINVWCAAGKGTFGTEEIVSRIHSTGLHELVSHRRLILPQLGAPGVQGYKVRRQAGFTVRYGPIRSRDLPAYLDNNGKATAEMRRVSFTLRDRIVLIPMDLLHYGRYAIIASIAAGAVNWLLDMSISPTAALASAAIPAFGGTLSGAGIMPVLLPWLPGRSFSIKGALAGLICLAPVAAAFLWRSSYEPAELELCAWLLMWPAIASYVGMNFTGSSTYTSLSGVRKEMKVAVPLQITAFVLGLGLWIAAL
jgi:acetyl-CoA decarbonylase/synthase complex subunit gamma